MRLIKIIGEITSEAIYSVAYFAENNLVNFARLLRLALPYIMYLIGQNVMLFRGEYTVGSEVLIPIVFFVIIHYLLSTANKLRKGSSIPVPDKRFTEVDDDGEVSVENKRIHELILYLADLEDWMERKGIL